MEKKRILLIEDNPDDEALAVRALQKSNTPIEVKVARDGQEALDYLFAAEEPDLPDLVLLDLKLPKVDGITVLTRLRGNPRTKHLSVVVLTSSKVERDLINCYDAGANSYVRKPLDFSEFSVTAAKICAYWLDLNESPRRS